MARKDKKNDKRRMTARERVDGYFQWLREGRESRDVRDVRTYVLRMLANHARATLKRRDERVQSRHVAFMKKYGCR